VFVWVNSTTGWVIHGQARATFERATTVARLLSNRLGWETAVGSAPPLPRRPSRGAPTASLAARSPAPLGAAGASKREKRCSPRVAATEDPARPLAHSDSIGPVTAENHNTLPQLGSILSDLRAYYAKSGISATHFKCPMATTCRSACNDFISACEAFVGSEYETGRLPRILFISADPARDLSNRDPSRRALEFVRLREEREPRPQQGSRAFPRHAHWYQTFRFAHDLLNPLARAAGFGSIPFADTRKYFAHTNSAKCKDAAQGTDQGRDLLFRNCRQFIPGEVRALRPDAIITQGIRARDSIAGAFRVLATNVCPENPRYRYQVLNIEGKDVLKIEMSHPTARGGLYQREVREAWDWYMRVGRDFLLKTRR
jgi:hypothetical protein